MTLVANQTEQQTMYAANVGGRSMGSFRQRPVEAITYQIDYSNWLAEAEVINSVSYTIAPATSPAALISGSTIVDGTKLVFLFSNGVEGKGYSVVVNIITSTGQTKSDSFSISVGTFNAAAAQNDVITQTSAAIAAANAAAADLAVVQSLKASVDTSTQSVLSTKGLVDAAATTVLGYKNEVLASVFTASGYANTAVAAVVDAETARDAAANEKTNAQVARTGAETARDTVTASLAGFVTTVANLSTSVITLALRVDKHIGG